MEELVVGNGRVDDDADRTVIGAMDVVVNVCRLYKVHGSRTSEDIVDPPADIAFSNAFSLAPPGVSVRLVAEMAEGIGPAGLDPLIELFPLLGSKATGFGVGFWSGQVNLLMSGVEVAHHENPFAGIDGLLKASPKVAIEIQFVGDSTEVAIFATSVGKVGVDEGEGAEGGDLNTAFTIKFLDAHLGEDQVEGASAVEGDAAVALFLGAAEVRLPAVGMAGLLFELLREGSDFLETDDLGIFLVEPLEKALSDGGPEAIDVPTDDLHGSRGGGKESRFAIWVGAGEPDSAREGVHQTASRLQWGRRKVGNEDGGTGSGTQDFKRRKVT